MLRQKKKWKVVVSTALVAILLLSSLTYAATTGVKKIQEAYYGTIKIIYNGRDRTAEFDPFIVNGTTYVPLRTMSDIFNKNVGWDPITNTATVTDKATEDTGFLQNQIILKDIEITQLQKKIDDLEKDADRRGDKSLRDVEKDLNKDYDRYERIDFDITLKGTERRIDVRIEVDLSKDRSRWNSLSKRQKSDYIQDICDDILYEFPDADIDGYIRDSDDRRDLLTFYTTSRGDVVIDDDDRYDIYDRDRDISLRDLERDLDDMYYDYFDDITLDIRLKGNSRDVTFTIDVDYDYYKKEWKDLSDSQIRRLMSNIYDDIEYEWRNAEITGYVYDTDGKSDLAEYYKTSSGSERFSRY